MSTVQQSDVLTGTTAEPTMAQSLREVADWLDAHPEIKPRHAFAVIHALGRSDLEDLALALGDRAREDLSYGNNVEIGGRFGSQDVFGGVHVYAHLPVAQLADEPVPPKYRPILPPADEAGGEW